MGLESQIDAQKARSAQISSNLNVDADN